MKENERDSAANWERFSELMDQLQSHPEEWVNTPEGAAVLDEAFQCMPPEIANLVNSAIQFKKSLIEIFRQQEQDPGYLDTPDGCRAFGKALSEAPPHLKELVRAVLIDMGLFPQARFVNDEGEPMFSLEQIAETMGVSVEDVEETMPKLDACHPGAPRTYCGRVHRLQ